MNKINPFEGKAVKFDTAEQLEHLAELARGYGLILGACAFEPYAFFRISSIGTQCYDTFSVPKNTDTEIHYSDFIMNIEAAKGSDQISRPEQPDMVNHPSHYNVKGFEVIDIIDAFGLNFNMGNALKYLLRADKKGNKKQDIQKALWYLQREINTK